MTAAKIQHYVPQFLLRSFAVPKKAQVWVYDKSSGRSFISNTKNVASENRFYDFECGDQRLSLEPWLADLEARAQLVVKYILESDSVSALSNEQRHVLAAFLAVQLTRTKTFREEWGGFPRMLREYFEKSGDQVARGSQAEDLIKDFSKNETKEQTARIVHQAPQHYAAHFLDKEWVLATTTPEQPFLLSDNPLARQNLIEQPHRGNLGLKSPGIEI